MAKLITTLLFIGQLLLPQSATALLKTGDPLPEFTGTGISGEQISSASLKGRPLLLKIGTTWCPTCSTQSKTLTELHDYLKERNIQLIEVFVQESAETVRHYFANKGYQQPDQIMLDKGELARKLNVYLIPRLILTDENLVVQRDGADMSASALKAAIEGLRGKD